MLYFALVALGVIDAAGYSVIAPVGPAISFQTGAGPGVLGALVAVFGIGQILGYPVGGRAIRQFSASTLLLVGLALIALGDLAFVLGEGLSVYFPARFVAGIGAGSLWLGVAFATIERFPGDAYRRVGGVFAAYSIGSIIGPALGAIGGIRGPFLAHLGFVLLGFLLVARLGRPAERLGFGSDRAALREPAFIAACAGVMLASVGLATLEGPLTLHFDDLLSQAQLGAMYVAVAVVVGVSAVLAGRLPPRRASLVACPLVVAGLGAAGATGTLRWWAVALAFTGVGIGLLETGSLGVLLEAVGVERIVLAMVIWSQLWALGYLVGPVTSGWLAEGAGFGAVSVVPLLVSLFVVVPLLRSPLRAPVG